MFQEPEGSAVNTDDTADSGTVTVVAPKQDADELIKAVHTFLAAIKDESVQNMCTIFGFAKKKPEERPPFLNMPYDVIALISEYARDQTNTLLHTSKAVQWKLDDLGSGVRKYDPSQGTLIDTIYDAYQQGDIHTVLAGPMSFPLPLDGDTRYTGKATKVDCAPWDSVVLKMVGPGCKPCTAVSRIDNNKLLDVTNTDAVTHTLTMPNIDGFVQGKETGKLSERRVSSVGPPFQASGQEGLIHSPVLIWMELESHIGIYNWNTGSFSTRRAHEELHLGMGSGKFWNINGQPYFYYLDDIGEERWLMRMSVNRDIQPEKVAPIHDLGKLASIERNNIATIPAEDYIQLVDLKTRQCSFVNIPPSWNTEEFWISDELFLVQESDKHDSPIHAKVFSVWNPRKVVKQVDAQGTHHQVNQLLLNADHFSPEPSQIRRPEIWKPVQIASLNSNRQQACILWEREN